MPVKKSRVLIAPLAAVAAALAIPAGASAEIVEVGAVPPASPPSCPARPCLAVSRTTGYQAKVGTARAPMTIPKTGRIVAWTIALGNPGAQQTTFFNQRLGGESEAQITIIDPRQKLRSRVLAEGDSQKLQPYFGTTAQFALKTSIRVHKGEVVALTVPTRAPALAAGLGGGTSWRASPGGGRGPRRRQVVGRERRARQVRGHLHADRAAARGPAHAVLLPVPDGAPDLQRDADPGPAEGPDAGAVARRLSRGRRPGSAGRTR